MSESFSIGVLAERVGVTEGTLRTWNVRFGFPEGRRTTGGHRRFSPDDVRRVQRVLEAKSAGLPLGVAIQTVLDQDRLSLHPSVFGALGEQFPELRPSRLSRTALLATTRAVEDECLARGDHPIVLGAFQHRYRFEQSAARWHELARTARWSGVVADFGGTSDASASPARCDLPADAPMRREWTVVVVGDSFSAVVAAWEVPVEGAGRATFETIVSARLDVAAAAGRVLTGVMGRQGLGVPSAVARRLAAPVPQAAPPLLSADRLLGRIVHATQELSIR